MAKMVKNILKLFNNFIFQFMIYFFVKIVIFFLGNFINHSFSKFFPRFLTSSNSLKDFSSILFCVLAAFHVVCLIFFANKLNDFCFCSLVSYALVFKY